MKFKMKLISQNQPQNKQTMNKTKAKISKERNKNEEEEDATKKWKCWKRNVECGNNDSTNEKSISECALPFCCVIHEKNLPHDYRLSFFFLFFFYLHTFWLYFISKNEKLMVEKKKYFCISLCVWKAITSVCALGLPLSNFNDTNENLTMLFDLKIISDVR